MKDKDVKPKPPKTLIWREGEDVDSISDIRREKSKIEKTKVKKNNMKEKIEEVIKNKRKFYIAVKRKNIQIEQETDEIKIIEDNEMINLMSKNSHCKIYKNDVNVFYVRDDDTFIAEFNQKYEKLLIRSFK